MSRHMTKPTKWPVCPAKTQISLGICPVWLESLLSVWRITGSLATQKVGWLCWGLTSQSTIFQLCWDGAIASWVINQYFRGVKCLAQGHNTAEVGLEPRTSRSGVRHSTTEPPRSPYPKSAQRRLIRLDGRPGLLFFVVLWLKWRNRFVSMFCTHSKQMSRDLTKPTKWLCTQRRLRSAWASAQSDQSLRCPHEESLGP